MIDIYETLDRRLRRRRLPHRHDEARQRRVLAEVRAARCCEFAQQHGKREFFMFGEVFDTTKSFTSHFTTTDRMQSVLDFPFQDAARNFASGGAPTDQLGHVLRRRRLVHRRRLQRLPAADVPRQPRHGPDRQLRAWPTTRARATPSGWPATGSAHELMYFSRGNPVIYYGDEQGFTGPGGDQDARQTLFASRVPEYLDDDLLGTAATHAPGQLRRRRTRCTARSATSPSRDRAAPGAARRRAPAPAVARRTPGSTRSPGSTARAAARVRGRAEQQRAAGDRGDPDVHDAARRSRGCTARARRRRRAGATAS